MKFTKPFYTLTLLLLCCSMAYSQNAGQVRKLKNELGKITGSKEFKTATIGFCVMDVETGKVLVETNSEKSLIPASTMKLITTGAGLALLGDTFRFKTEFKYTGEIKNGSLNGILQVIGKGDPTLGSDRWNSTNIDTILNTFSQQLTNNGIKKINGKIIPVIDYYKTGGLPPGYAYEDILYKYGAAPSSINIFENAVNSNTGFQQLPYKNDGVRHYLFLADDDPAKISRLNNELPYTLIDNTYRIFYGSNYNATSIDFNTPNIFGVFLKQRLKSQGISITDSSHYTSDLKFYKEDFATTLYTNYSPPLSEISIKTNVQSINLYAECILRAIGIQKYGPSSLDSSIAVTKRFWKTEVGDLQGLRMTDGSGLSRSNLCTPLLFCKMLTAYTKRDNFNSFYNTIPIAGREGTVKNFAVGTAAENNARLKSGSMSRVKCYAGYVKGKNGKLYAVSIMFNNFEPDATVTATCAKLIGKVAELKGGKPKKEFVVNRGR